MISKSLIILTLINLVKLELVDPKFYEDNNFFLFDDITKSNDNKWAKIELTWNLVNHSSILGHKSTFDQIDKAFKAWETISIFKFNSSEDLNSDILIYFVPLVHKLDDEDMKFARKEVLAHAFYPLNGDIHFNIEIDWNATDIFLTVLHEIGHSLGLNHVMDDKSIMFPYYLDRGENYKLSESTIDATMIREKYIDLERRTNNKTSTPSPPLTTPSTTSECVDKTFTGVYPGFECLEMVDWCRDDLNFSNIYSLDDKLYIYKDNIFWIIEKDNKGLLEVGIHKYSHQIYFNERKLENDLISVIKLDFGLVMFYTDKAVLKHLSNCNLFLELNLNKINTNININVNGIIYNKTEDSVYLFSKAKPKSYTKISKFSSNNNVFEEKPIELFYLHKYDYDKVFEFDNKVFFMKDNKFNYYDYGLRTIVRDISFKDYFLRDECNLLPYQKV